MIKEADIERYLIQRCRRLDFLTYKFTSPSNAGVPDRIIIGNGHVIFCELKAPGQHIRKLQQHVIKDMIAHGARVVYDIDSKQKVDKLLESIGEKS